MPKTLSKKRVISNTHVYDFELSDEDMKHLDSFDEGAHRISLPSIRLRLRQLTVVVIGLVTDWDPTDDP